MYLNSSKKVRKLKFDWRFLSCYKLIFLAFGIIGKPCYSSLQWCAICYDYAIWGCAAHLNIGVGVKWNVPKCIAIVIHSKNSRVRFDPEKSPRGQTHFGVRLTRNPSQKDILDSDSGNLYPASRSVWPRNGSGPHGTLFRVKSDPEVF